MVHTHTRTHTLGPTMGFSLPSACMYCLSAYLIRLLLHMYAGQRQCAGPEIYHGSDCCQGMVSKPELGSGFEWQLSGRQQCRRLTHDAFFVQQAQHQCCLVRLLQHRQELRHAACIHAHRAC